MTADAPAIQLSLVPEVNEALWAIRRLSLQSMFFFGKCVLGYTDLVGHLHGRLCKLLENPENKRVRITMPRGFFKSTVAIVVRTMWKVIRNPNISCLIVQNTLQNAMKRLSEIDKHFQNNQLFRALFPDLMPDKNCVWSGSVMTVKRTSNQGEGTWEAASTRTQKISNHYHDISEDDTVTPDLDDMSATNVLPSPEDIQQAIGWHRQVTPLFVSPKDGFNLIVGTRWAQADLIAWVRDNQSEYIAFEVADRNADGTPTFPERFDDAVLTGIRNLMGEYLYACNYQGNPMRSEDMIFKPEWFAHFYVEVPTGLLVYITVDPASDAEQTKTKAPDFNAIMVCGKDQRTGHVYVLDYWRKRCNPGDLVAQLFKMVATWNPLQVACEAVAYQNTLIYWIKEQQRAKDTHFIVEALPNSSSSKASKIMALQPIVQNGTLRYRISHRELITELEAFPYGANDDLADALSMMLRLFHITSGAEKTVASTDGVYRFEDAMLELTGRGKPAAGTLMDIFDGPRVSGWSGAMN